MVRYYGFYSNVWRGKRQKAGNDDAVPCVIESQGDEKTFRRNWARLIQKIYETDPTSLNIWPFGLSGPGRHPKHMARQISNTPLLIFKSNREHLALWLVRSRPPPKTHGPPNIEYAAADLQIQPHTGMIYGDPEYSWDDYIQA